LLLQLLGLKAGESFKDSIVNQAYDQLILSQLEPGYSQTTVSSRAELLDIARGDIITSKGRSKDRHDSITIPYDLLPGALALLAEVRGTNGTPQASFIVLLRLFA
jgi:hypothetical protein